ncbi:diacylglycerol/lipid kinase family protein [Lapillicoccus jejuensis]|uniref:Diacylglycerol kinase family enzyme n=1 Tax=Lapillicoccus jejuensis TaxID=402171 RepID=A0A542DWV4_9MICO|nr:diacylglycerol kinase family protein [Lapillicoccus jejuensis]TQJ07567.1 diacylglycerol kinase family enzyme [Lapillicoccus jejuensis]
MSTPPGTGDSGAATRRRVAVVVNPTKFDDLDKVRDELQQVCHDEGWEDPWLIETSAEDPGVGQAKEAVDAGVDLVCPLGGDGTVRAVATSLVGTDTPIGLLPGGTGNLLARNLGLPIDSVTDALRVALSGTARRVDVGLVRLLPESPSPDALLGDEDAADDDPRREDEEIFLVMCGIGVDAEVMAGTSEKVKGVLGWPAYVLSGLTRMWRRGFKVRVSGGLPQPRVQRAKTVLIGNCGKLQGGIEVLPDARLDDGRLDGAILAPRGPLSWAALGADVVTHHRRGHKRFLPLAGRSITVVTQERIEAQVDGDPMGQRYGLATRVLPAALLVRVPLEDVSPTR